MSSGITKDRARLAGMLVLALILVTTSSYMRTRTLDEADTLDWLVVLQLALSMVAGFLGILLMRRDSLLGYGAKVAVIYLIAIFASGLFSSYPALVFGY